MNRLFVDTNVMLDVVLKRELFIADSSRVLDIGFRGEVTLHATPLTFATCLYVARKSLGYDGAMELLRLLEQHFCIAPMDGKQLHTAFHAKAPDFEDMLQYQSAVAVGCNCIITRDIHHFPSDGIPVLTPREYLQRMG